VKRLRILLVEDKARVAERLKVQLERLGHEVVGLANDGQEAVSCAWRLEPDLIIMEQHLPIIDGIETAQTILAHKPIPIILLTAYAAADFVRQVREVGVPSSCSPPTRPPISSGRSARLGSWPTWLRPWKRGRWARPSK